MNEKTLMRAISRLIREERDTLNARIDALEARIDPDGSAVPKLAMESLRADKAELRSYISDQLNRPSRRISGEPEGHIPC